MSYLPNAEDMRAVALEKQKVIMLQELTDKYIKQAEEKIENESSNSIMGTVIFISENDSNLSHAIAKRLVEVLIEKAYKSEMFDTGDFVMLNILWLRWPIYVKKVIKAYMYAIYNK